MPNDNPGHDVRDENRNTENFATGVENAPNDTAQQGLDTAGENAGINTINIVYLNDKNGTGDGTTYLATDGPDIFVYDLSQSDATSDRFEVFNFNSSEDTLIFINVEPQFGNPGTTTVQNINVYNHRATSDDGTFLTSRTIAGVGKPNFDTYRVTETNTDTGTGITTETYQDFVTVTEDEGGTRSGLFFLDYPDDTTDPTPDAQFAHVYVGDPLAVEGIG